MISLLLIITSLQLPAQNNQADWEKLVQINIKADFVTQDAIGNIYLITSEGNIYKLNREGVKTHDFRLKRFGRPIMLDATNPMKIIVLYPDFSTIVFLDNTLSKQGYFNLSQEGIPQVKCIAFSADNNYWVYDQIQRKLIKIAENRDIVYESEDFQMLIDDEIKPVFMIERNQRLFLTDPKHGIFEFDIFGQYVKQIHLKGFHSFTIEGHWLYYQVADQLKAYHLRTFQSSEVELPESTFKMIHFKRNRLVALTANALTLYRKN